MLPAGFNPSVAARHEPPYVSGIDAARVIDEVGNGFVVGDQVMTMAQPSGEHGGAYAQFLIAETTSVSLMPAGTGYAQTSTLPMNGLIALHALDQLGLHPGDVLAVTGSASTRVAMQLRLPSTRA